MIRPYRNEDLEELLSTWEASSRRAHPFLSEAFLAAERENIPKLYLPNAETWVAEAEGHVIGFVALLGNEVGALFVHPARHRQGIGGRLLNKARELRGELEVEVFKANHIGCAFYDKCGFTPMDEKIHAETGQPLLRLRLPASSAGA